jgi:hypothetical protein
MMYRVPDGVQRAELDGEEVMLDPQSGVYYLLNATGRFLVACFADGVSFEVAVDRLADETGAGREDVRKDADLFVTAMIERGLLEARSESTTNCRRSSG